MTKQLKSSAKKVQDFLAEKGFGFTVRELDSSTRTAKEAAASIGCQVSQIAKSLIFKDQKSGKPVLIVASGINRVNIKKVEFDTGLKLEKADADYVRNHMGFAIGGVPPIAHSGEVFTILDSDLKAHEVIWAAAGTPNAVFELKPENLEQLTPGQWLSVSE
ncbi:YbaK/EbsC family protein [Aliikangiella coralliicola]|uniref:YbaK/EbsC family protein n=1 Tax=Aliikangiella coralliicola TaxID=2592383 RepID=A0A545TWE5_9GAMM|nr:YbaK/EbsC family protein [Aliikangiella coralliicola]TQV81540.1 YbaK/EbsC family protein [Aliikangiella coralliicola]